MPEPLSKISNFTQTIFTSPLSDVMSPGSCDFPVFAHVIFREAWRLWDLNVDVVEREIFAGWKAASQRDQPYENVSHRTQSGQIPIGNNLPGCLRYLAAAFNVDGWEGQHFSSLHILQDYPYERTFLDLASVERISTERTS